MSQQATTGVLWIRIEKDRKQEDQSQCGNRGQEVCLRQQAQSEYGSKGEGIERRAGSRKVTQRQKNEGAVEGHGEAVVGDAADRRVKQRQKGQKEWNNRQVPAGARVPHC